MTKDTEISSHICMSRWWMAIPYLFNHRYEVGRRCRLVDSSATKKRKKISFVQVVPFSSLIWTSYSSALEELLSLSWWNCKSLNSCLRLMGFTSLCSYQNRTLLDERLPLSSLFRHTWCRTSFDPSRSECRWRRRIWHDGQKAKGLSFPVRSPESMVTAGSKTR